MKIFLFSTLLAINSACASTPKTLNQINGIDTFGSKRVSASVIEQQFGEQLNQLSQEEQNRNYDKLALIKQRIESSIKNQYHFAYVKISLVTYFQPNPGKYITIDVVEPEDVASRMAFLPEPSGKFDDPNGLIALWEEYLQLGIELHRLGQFEYPKTCPAWHCIHGFENPKLVPYLKKFNDLVPLNESKLVTILSKDARPQFRANAAFLLAHIKNGKALIRYLLPIVCDPVDVVRNNAVRVLSEVAMKHPELHMPVEPILKVLNFPATTDRNKAGYALLSLSLIQENKLIIIRDAGKILIEMLKLKQPNNHDLAYSILKNLSGKTFGEHDYEAWENWLNQELLKKP